jgi:hypothetical protein
MVVDGWLVSWCLVPDYRQLGHSFLSSNSFYSSETFFTFWALSVPLGSIITALGLGLYSRLEKMRFLVFIFGSLVLLAWLGFWSQSVLYPVLYGIGGGVILFSFCISIWSLAKIRLNNKNIAKNVLDLRAVGYIFFVISAWGMCGLLGIPSFGLRPEQLMEFNSHHLLLTMGAKVLICFTLGWVFLALSQYIEYRSQKMNVIQS